MASKSDRVARLVAFAQHYVRFPPSPAAFSVRMEDYPAPEPPRESRRERKARLRLEKENKGKPPNPMDMFYSREELKVMGRRKAMWFPKDRGPFDQLDIEPWSLRMLQEYTLDTIRDEREDKYERFLNAIRDRCNS